MVPSVEVMVAPVRLISGQNLETENLPPMAPRLPKTGVPTTAVAMALKW